MGKETNSQDLINYAIIGVGGIALIVLLPSIISFFKAAGSILEIPGDIIQIPKDVLAIMREGAKGKPQAYTGPSNTTVPGISTGTMMKYLDKPVYANTSMQAVRAIPGSNRPAKSWPKQGDFLGYFYSIAGEKLGDKTKAWVYLTDVPNGSLTGWYPFDNISLNKTGIGCLN